ncbi:MAG: hypothetical protein ACE5H9_07605 [Anaerolineae bacterium]
MSNHPGARAPRPDQDPAGLDLAARHAPRILFDRHEPFLPLRAGYTIFRADGYSPSFPRAIGLRPVAIPTATLAIEYAIWWDWDITHLYDLEHVWVFLDAGGAVVRVEASWHGQFWSAPRLDGRSPALHGGTHPVLYAQPGKHALLPDPALFLDSKDALRRSCTVKAGRGGVLVTPVFRDVLAPSRTEPANALVERHLKSHAFEPALEWDRVFDVRPELLIPWPQLAAWIPQRVEWILARLAAGMTVV